MSELLQKRITSRTPMHIVLCADDSGSMKGEPAGNATKAIHAWVNELYVATRGKRPYFRFSLVLFGSQATIAGEALDVRDVDVSSFVLAGGGGHTNMAEALSTVRALLSRDGAPAEHCPPFVFLFTDGRPTDVRGHETDEVRRAAAFEAATLKALPLACGSPFIITIGFGKTDDPFMQSLASTPGHYHRILSAQDLIRLLPEIGTPTIAVEGEEGTVGHFVKQTAIKDR